MALFEPIFDALAAANVRYVLVGGLATVLHGYARLTADADLILDLDPEPLRAGLRALAALGFVPRAPVAAEDFADAAKRQAWVDDKGMRVFSMWDPKNPMRELDIFAQHPIPFDNLYARSETMRLGSTTVRIASISDLVTLKRLAGRPQDLLDIEALEAIARRRGL